MIFVGKGYINIVRSSVLNYAECQSTKRICKTEYLHFTYKGNLWYWFMAAGFYLTTKDAGMEVMFNVLTAVIFVVIGIYFIFGGFLPLCIQALTKRKDFFYKKERTPVDQLYCFFV